MSGYQYDQIGSAAHRKLRAQEDLARANRDLAAALRALSLFMPKCHVGPEVRADLALHGFEPEQVARLGLSDGNIRVILDKS